MHTILAARTDFSIGQSILKIDTLIEEAVRLNEKAVAITDTMSITAMLDFTERAKKKNIRPIIGTRLRLVDDLTWRPDKTNKKVKQPEYSALVYARTEEGMKAIYRLLTLGNSESNFYYVSRISIDQLYAEIDTVGPDALSVVLGDEFPLVRHPDIGTIIDRLKGMVSELYVPILPIKTPYFGRINKISAELVESYGVKPLLVRPCLYKPGSADSQEIMTLISDGDKISDPWFLSRHNRDMHPMSALEMVDQIKWMGEHLRARGVGNVLVVKDALINTRSFVDAIDYTWSKQPVSLPQMAPDEFQAVVAECKKGFVERFSRTIFGHRPTAAEQREVYLPRLTYELEILKKLGFSGYFLLVQDIVRYAKSNGILVGPGRGSVGGSLVAYLMGITDCDPIRFGLLFERFINPDRIDLPDADLDFMSERRGEIIQYLIDKYGKERVAGVSNFGTLAAASAIRDVGRVLNMPESEYSVSKLVPKLHGQPIPLEDAANEVADIKSFSVKHSDVWPIMLELEGTIRNMAQHAAGLVVAGCDLVERAVVETRKDSTVVCFDKRTVENQGLVKVDILGLTTLDITKLTLDYIEERHGFRPDINAIPLDDPKILERFAQGRTTGVFQFESGGMRHLLKEMGADGKITFEDITAATALYRPGPMESGMMESFYLRKQGREEIDYDHPLMEPILQETFGVMVYQEQVMQVSRVIAGYSGAEADKLRKIMGKKLPEEMAKERGKFVDGCVKTISCDERWAGALFDKIEGFAGYGFNKSHSIEYTLISYQTMWLKVNYPVEFLAAALTLMDTDKLPALLREAGLEGITVDVPDINQSSNRFEIVTNTRLVMPFQAIKGISANTTNAILEARKAGPFASKADLLSRVEKRRCNKNHQESLEKVGAFANIEPGQLPTNHPDRIMDQIELLPGLINKTVPVKHHMHHDKISRAAVASIVDEYRGAAGEEEGTLIRPHFGKKARFMIITDAPGGDEDAAGVMGMTRSTSVKQALDFAGIDMQDVYWTGLIKRPKRGSQVSSSEIASYKDYLMREITVLHPPVIVLLGTATARFFFPELKGKVYDIAGKIEYSKTLDCNIVMGFNPGEIWHDPDKQETLNSVFEAVSQLLI